LGIAINAGAALSGPAITIIIDIIAVFAGRSDFSCCHHPGSCRTRLCASFTNTKAIGSTGAAVVAAGHRRGCTRGFINIAVTVIINAVTGFEMGHTFASIKGH
jgi:hypothetical protein